MHSLSLIIKFVSRVFPLVSEELGQWRRFAAERAEGELQIQALASIRDKKFHCQGGSIYSLYPGTPTGDLIRLIVALQTISDYLDNLCDRAGITDETAFRQLHLAMTDALNPAKSPSDYYRYYPYANDGGYLAALVKTCQDIISGLPAYDQVQDYVLELASLYSELQTYKHIDWACREARMLRWAEPHLRRYPGITAWEFAAATGSTLGMFMLCALAANPRLERDEAASAFNAYFPWITGLHILMDYFIDRNEDRTGGDLNFVAYYLSEADVKTRLTLFWQQAMSHAKQLKEPVFQQTVVRGLFAMYLSDPKADAPAEKPIKDALLDEAGTYTRLLYNLCRLLRKRGIL
ncbi:MAG: tetraprenyl-beta-curcumene synthase family protein [Negativicutes bacterium]|nr:tetraprenyl-beta-curcumene synthase family protein [Negativicutes bacterium]